MASSKNTKDNPMKRFRCDSSANSENLSQLNELLDSMSGDENSFKQAIALILQKENFKNTITEVLVPEVSSLREEVKELKFRMEEMEQYSRRDCLKITGIPESKNENTDDLVLNVINGLILTKNDGKMTINEISRSHRVGRFNPKANRPRDIIVKFLSYRNKAIVYAKKSNLKSYNRNPSKQTGPIFINEALTKQRASLLWKTRNVVKEQGLDSCWTYDGRIFAKTNGKQGKKISIGSEEDLIPFQTGEDVRGCDDNDLSIDDAQEIQSSTPVCFTQRYSGINGEVLYDTGCQTPLICSNAHAKQCIECCSTDACNHQGCGASDYPSIRGPLCFNCPQSMDPTVCRNVRICHENEICHLHEEVKFGESYFASFCSHRNKCGSDIASMFGKRSTELCLVCCDSDLCNSDCGKRTSPITNPSTTTTTANIPTTTLKYSFPFDCWEIFRNGYNVTGVYQIYPWGSSGKSIDVLCNMDVDPKGWTVFQWRHPLTENFNRTWMEYKHGFGNVSGEFWLGNEVVHLLTTPHRTLFHIGITSINGGSWYERFDNMKVSSETQKFTITLGSASGTAGDRSTNKSSGGSMDGMRFTTYDRDNDLISFNCAAFYGGGWWFNSCYNVFLNGPRTHDYYEGVLPSSTLNSSILMITRL